MVEALVPHAKRLRIGRSNFRLLLNIKSKESTLQLVYDVMRFNPFFKAFLMDNKKHIVNLELFRDMLHICPRLPGQSFVEPPFKVEIIAFIRFLRHSAAIRKLTDVNVNKLYQPWRSFAAIINKCLTEKNSGYNSLRLSQAQILWGLYHKRNVDYAYLMWEDFVYQVEHKDSKKSNEIYYPRFIKVIIYHFMSKDPLIPRRNKVNWHYVRDDHVFSTINLVSRHQNTEQFGALLPIELTNEVIRNSNAYKEYYAVATGATPSKPKASVQKTRSSSDTAITPPTAAAGLRLTTSKKGKQAAKASKAKSLSALSEPKHTTKEEPRDEESFDPIPKTPKDTDDEGNGEENLGLNVGREEGHDEEEDELYRDVNINQGRGIQTTQEVEDSHMTLTPVNPDGQQQSSSVSSQLMTSMLNLTLDVGMESIFETTSQMDAQTPTSVAPLPMSAPTLTSSTIRMNEAVKVAIQIQSDRLRDEAQKENDEFLKTIDENMQKIIKEHVKEQVKTSYAVADDLSEMELKKILIEKIEGNKSIQRSDEQKNLYKALVEAYESDKIILDIYGETITLKRRRDDDADKDEEPSLDQTEGLRDAEKERSLSQQALQRRKQPGALASQHKGLNLDRRRQAMDTLTPKLIAGPTYELLKGSCKSLVELEYHLEEVYKATTNQLDWVNPEGQQYPHNLLKPLPLIPNNRGLRVIPFDHFISNDLEYLRGDLVPRTMWIKVPICYDKHALWEVSHWGHKRQQFYGFTVNRASAHDVYSKRRIIAVTKLKIVEWHNYKHLDWITVRRDDDKLYKFKEGDLKRLRIQDIEDMLLLLVQGKLTNLTVKECFSFNKKLNLTKPDTYRSDLKCKEAYTAYSNPRGFIYQNKDKKNRLMRIDELHKFSDGTLIDVRTALDDRLKWI
uniref:Monodehydroascorbate reductase n=1 Tax=Tanacetum cinerariifolium TaxID=118510 RepID=A0A699H1U0_TANCI|nr:hypothetical protein [Tanacetum cinerariifolium]